MRSLFYILAVVAVMALGFWAYRENYRTQAKLSDISALQGEIAHLRESLGVLKAEWAYLNRPDRLRELAAVNFDRLALLPLAATQFGAAAQVTYPLPELPAPETGPEAGSETGPEAGPEAMPEQAPAATPGGAGLRQAATPAPPAPAAAAPAQLAASSHLAPLVSPMRPRPKRSPQE